MYTCPLPSNKNWKKLIELHGEAKAKVIWIAYDGAIPNSYLTNINEVLTLKVNSNNEEKVVILSSKIDSFYNSLSQQEKEKLGNIEDIYNELLYPLQDEEFVDMLKCTL